MKTKNIILTWLFVNILSIVFAQEKPTAIRRFRVQEFILMIGSVSEPKTFVSLSDFKSLSPKSDLLNNDFTGYKSYDDFGTDYNAFTALVSLQFSDKQKSAYKRNPLLRIGISYYSGAELTKSNYKDTKTTIDTLVSAQNNPAYVDSVYKNSYSMNYSNNQVRLDGSLIYRTNPQMRWSWYAGIGLTAGISINANTTIWNTINTYRETRYDNGDVFTSSNYKDKENESLKEEFSNKNIVAFSGYLPLGVDFRIARKNELLKHAHLFFELRPGINSTSIPELKTITTSSLQVGLGLKISLN